MSLFTWYTRRAGGLAMILLTLLCYWVISKEAAASRSGYDYHQDGALDAHAPNPARGEGYTAHVFAYYCLFIHILTFIFPMRSCYAMFDITRSLKKVIKNKSMRDFKVAPRRRNSSTSLSSAETLTSSHACSSASSEAGDIDLEPYNDVDALDDTVIHAIIIPNYKEEVDTLRETLDVLASHPQARGCYDVSVPPLPHLLVHFRRATVKANPRRRSTSPWRSARSMSSSRPVASSRSISKNSAALSTHCTPRTSLASRLAKVATWHGPLGERAKDILWMFARTSLSRVSMVRLREAIAPPP